MAIRKLNSMYCKQCGQEVGKRFDVFVDFNSKYSGTVFPTGSTRAPVNNIEDALLIVEGLRQPNDVLPPRIVLL